MLGGPPDPEGKGKAATLYPRVTVTIGMKVTHRATRFSGSVMDLEADAVVLQSVSGDRRLMRLLVGAFSVEGRTVTLVRPAPVVNQAMMRTASGSMAVGGHQRRAKVAQASRIWVEGIHDAQLVERVWGDDLRAEGIVVERLDGIDELAHHVTKFDPAPGRRLGVLVDHLVPGSKEQRLADAVRDPNVLVTGTPFVDVWQAVRPHVLGIARWPSVPTVEDWKQGICRRIGHVLGATDPPMFWRELLRRTRSIADLEPTFVGAVESLLDSLIDG